MSTFETTEGVAKRIWNGYKKNAIKFGEPTVNDNENYITKEWESNELPTGAKITLRYSLKKGIAENKQRRNPRYLLIMKHQEKEEKFSGIYARKIFFKMHTLPKLKKSKSNILTEDKISFCENALQGL